MTINTDLSTELTPPIPAGAWQLDPTHSRVGFVVRHMMISKVRGSFDQFSADIHVGDANESTTLSAQVEMASIDTGNADRDGHLRTNDFFDVDQYPTMSLRSTGFHRHGDAVVMTADLTIKGVTRSVDFDLEFGGVGEDPWGNTRAGFLASTTINRRDFGIEWNAPLEAGGVLVGDKVEIEIDASIVRG